MTETQAAPRPSDRLDRSQAAEVAGMSLDAWTKQRQRGTAPEPDGQIGNSPWWFRRTVIRWSNTRRRRNGWDDRGEQ